MKRVYACRVKRMENRVEGFIAAKARVVRLMQEQQHPVGQVDGGRDHVWTASRRPDGSVKWTKMRIF